MKNHLKNTIKLPVYASFFLILPVINEFVGITDFIFLSLATLVVKVLVWLLIIISISCIACKSIKQYQEFVQRYGHVEKALKSGKKSNITNFKSKIVSSIPASPAAIAYILMDPQHQKHFTINCDSSTKVNENAENNIPEGKDDKIQDEIDQRIEKAEMESLK